MHINAVVLMCFGSGFTENINRECKSMADLFQCMTKPTTIM